MLSIPTVSVRDAINQSDLNNIAEMNRQVKFGNVLGCLRRTLYKAVPNATTGLITLPATMKCARILAARARAGTAAVGDLTIEALGATPDTTEVAVTHSGDILFHIADAYTSVDVEYEPLVAEAATISKLVVTTNVGALPGAVVLSNVTGYKTGGTAMAAMTIMAPGATPTTGQVALSASRETIVFAAADAIVLATVTYAKAPANELGAVLEAATRIL